MQAARAALSKRLYGNLARSDAELDRRSDILQSSQAGTAAYTSAWEKYMEVITVHDDAIKELRKEFFHVPA